MFPDHPFPGLRVANLRLRCGDRTGRATCLDEERSVTVRVESERTEQTLFLVVTNESLSHQQITDDFFEEKGHEERSLCVVLRRSTGTSEETKSSLDRRSARVKSARHTRRRLWSRDDTETASVCRGPGRRPCVCRETTLGPERGRPVLVGDVAWVREGLCPQRRSSKGSEGQGRGVAL